MHSSLGFDLSKMKLSGASFADADFSSLVSSLSFSQSVAMILGICGLLLVLMPGRAQAFKAPIYGYRSWLEPTILVQTRFATDARGMIMAGCKKFGDSPFTIRRYDTDITILPKKYLNELRLVSSSKLSTAIALSGNKVYQWTFASVMVESDLHSRILKDRLIAEMPKYLDLAKTELEYGWNVDIPKPSDWTEVDIQQVARMLIARMTAKIFLGSTACRNSKWLSLSIDFSKELSIVRLILTMFPTWMYPIVVHLIPGRYRLKKCLATAARIIGPLMEKHREAAKQRSIGVCVEEEDTLLHWMMDVGDEKENQVAEMSTLQCFMALASIHTTSTTISNVLFDLCAHPEWIPILIDEINDVTNRTGKLGDKDGVGVKEWLAKLEKLDSFLMESLRYNPVLLLAPSRYAIESHTFNDGQHIPAGRTISWANYFHQNDPSLAPEPHLFDPMRSYRKRYSSPEQKIKHLAGQADTNNLTFGYGRGACPGRFFAVGEIKTIVARLLVEFEFKYPEGKSRPRSIGLNEFSLPDPGARLMMRIRKDVKQ
ncbi:hypothetical protein V491_02323 [Pseudogymnoascus sp. VKM F-3775]|nr:hypothetical protein V491_02323 [Pseudogymnoascus sp. VKM F-3775]